MAETRMRGFTIIELLIVIVVIAILVAVSILLYVNIDKRAKDSATAADTASILKAMEMYRSLNDNKVPTSTADLRTVMDSPLLDRINWWPQGQYLSTPLSSSTERGNYLLYGYSYWHSGGLNIDGVTYHGMMIYYFQIYYWNYQSGQWMGKTAQWYGTVKKYAYDSDLNWWYDSATEASPCRTATIEQCRS